jgi:sterol desaturase/sphingolipid hydroxylase (fatty acid hydroxylase superfamily)
MVYEKRFFINIFFSFLNSILIFFILQKISFNKGLSFYETDYGLMSDLYWPWGVKFILGLLILDLVIYWQHRFFHQIPLLWRVHRMHHSDNEFDTSTALRFHPIEALISLLNRLLIIYFFGISFFCLVVFESLLNFSAMFNHSNFRLPEEIENLLRRYIITPDLHRIHHSLDIKDYNSNFGFSVTLWDWLFKSYKSKSRLDFKTSNIGALGFQNESKQKLVSLLIQPLD